MKSKPELRKYFSQLRNSIDIDERTVIDRSITQNLINSDLYLQSDLILVYVSVGSEVDTTDIILHSLSVGKKVAVPYCSNDKMDFYQIFSSHELSEMQFGIPTVDINSAKKAILTKNTLCIVPAYAFDKRGYRLGYGGGYYDRFLAANNVRSVGLCRNIFLVDSLPSEEHDIKTNIVLTEDKSIFFKEVYTYE